MSQDDVLFGYRLQLFDLAGRVGVAAPAVPSACTARPTTPGRRRSTGTAWRCCGRASGAGRRMPNQLSPLVEQRIVAFALATLAWGRTDRRASLGATVGRARGLGERRLALSAPARSQHARKRLSLGRRLPGALRAAPRARARAAHRGRSARRLVGHRLLLRRPSPGHGGTDLAADRDRRLPPPTPGPSSSAARAGTPPRRRPRRSLAASPVS